MQRSELYIADEAFLCGTAMELAPIVEVAHRAVGDGAQWAITRRMAKEFDDVVHGRSKRHADWCTAVPIR